MKVAHRKIYIHASEVQLLWQMETIATRWKDYGLDVLHYVMYSMSQYASQTDNQPA